MTEDNVTDITKARAEEASKQGTFNFLDRLAGRGYATEDVEICLDEFAGHKIEKLREDLSNTPEGDQANLIATQIEALREKARESIYTMHFQGIPNEEYDEVVTATDEQFPIKYTETRNPLSMALERTPIPQPDRETYFQSHLWCKYITGISDHTGATDSNITPEWVAAFLKRAPIAAIASAIDAISKLQMTTDWMDGIQGEDFLAKP